MSQPKPVGGEPGKQAKASEISEWRKNGYPGTDQEIAAAIVDSKDRGETF